MSPLRPLYDWTLRQAEKPYVAGLLFLVALIEPCLFPTPPDVLMLPAILARRDKAYTYAAICTLGSMLGGLIGYGIGALAMATVGHWIVDTYSLQDSVEHVRQGFHKWGVLIIAAKASAPFIPVPFFLVTILSGAMHFNMTKFIFTIVAVRSTRFSLEAWLLRRYGEPIRTFIERYLTWLTLGVIAALIIWLVLADKSL